MSLQKCTGRSPIREERRQRLPRESNDVCPSRPLVLAAATKPARRLGPPADRPEFPPRFDNEARDPAPGSAEQLPKDTWEFPDLILPVGAAIRQPASLRSTDSRVAGERQRAGENLVKNQAQRVDVGALIHGLALHLLGGQYSFGVPRMVPARVTPTMDDSIDFARPKSEMKT